MDDPELKAVKPERLTQIREPRRAAGGEGYTKFVRIMRLMLPLIALAIIAAMVAWPQGDRITPVAVQDTRDAKQAVSNELINPHFESRDRNNQPYTITAQRAVQSAKDPEVILLHEPRGHVDLNSGQSVDAAAQTGAYRQHAGKLMLEGDVRAKQSQGYAVSTDRLMIDTDAHQVWTDTAVQGAGPAGTIHSKGLRADMDTGVLIFTGPAKLTLNRGMKGLGS